MRVDNFSESQRKQIISSVERSIGGLALLPDVERVSEKSLSVGRIIGKGGFGEVHELRAPGSTPNTELDNSSDKQDDVLPYVLKKLRLDRPTQDPKKLMADLMIATADLMVEASLLAAMRHPNIIGLTQMALQPDGGYTNASTPFIVLDRLKETLEKRIAGWNDSGEAVKKGFGCWRKEDKVTPHLHDKIRILKSIASALSFLHENGVIHRDIKPDNIGFSLVDDQVKLFDFGTARVVPAEGPESLPKMTAKVGTVRYMAPEVMRGPYYGVSADTYSWAILAAETLTQVRPFVGYKNNYRGQAAQEHYRAVCNQNRRPDIKGVPKTLGKLLKRAWEPSSSKRPEMSAIDHALANDEEQAAGSLSSADR